MVDLAEFVWFDGTLQPVDAFHIDARDEGLLYGNGLFETTRTYRRRPWLWDRHLQRLHHSASALNLKIPTNGLPTADDIEDFVARLDADEVVIRLNVSAGFADEWGQIWMTARPLPEPKYEARLVISPYRISTADPYASHKSFHYGIRKLAHDGALCQQADGAIMLSSTDHVLEAAHANVFVRYRDRWVTPPLTGGVLAGTVRQLILESGSLVCSEERVALHDFRDADEIFLTNSVRGIIPVVRLDACEYSIGPTTIRLRTWLETQH